MLPSTVNIYSSIIEPPLPPSGESVQIGVQASDDSKREKGGKRRSVSPESHVRSTRRKWYSRRVERTARFKGSLAMGFPDGGCCRTGAGEKVPCSRCKSPFVTDRSKAEQICVTYNGACARAPILTTLPSIPSLLRSVPAYPITEKDRAIKFLTLSWKRTS